ncbi:MAG: hypothetical protein R6V19_16025 [Armatimonadota bacterium]
MNTYLEKDAVWSGDAKDTAKKIFAEAREKKRIREELPGIIEGLLILPSDFIIEVFQTEAQAELGALPDQNLVKDVLQQIVFRGSLNEGTDADKLKPAVNNLPPTHTKPTGMALAGTRFEVKFWKHILVKTARWLQSRGRPLPVEKKCGYKWVLVSRSPDKLSEPVEIGEGLYVETDYSGSECVKRALWLLEEAGVPKDILKIGWE